MDRSRINFNKINWSAKLKSFVFSIDLIEKTPNFAVVLDPHETGRETHSLLIYFRFQVSRAKAHAEEVRAKFGDRAASKALRDAYTLHGSSRIHYTK